MRTSWLSLGLLSLTAVTAAAYATDSGKAVGAYLGHYSTTLVNPTVDVNPISRHLSVQPYTLGVTANNSRTTATQSATAGGSSGGFQLTISGQTSGNIYTYVDGSSTIPSGDISTTFCQSQPGVDLNYAQCPNISGFTPPLNTAYIFVSTSSSSYQSPTDNCTSDLSGVTYAGSSGSQYFQVTNPTVAMTLTIVPGSTCTLNATTTA